MPVKPHTSTQQAYMKLLLVVAILICTDVAVVNSTSELMEHRRLGGFFTSLLKLVGAKTEVSFGDEWENAFRLQARQHLADSKKNTDSSLLTRELARKVEGKILPLWKFNLETLSSTFTILHLNEMKNEKELYANPAFTTWMNFAFRLQPEDPFPSMLNVLKAEMKNSKGFNDLLTLRASTGEGTNDLQNNKKLTKLFQKWQDIYDNQAPKHLPDTKTNTMSDTSADLHKFLPDLLNKIDSTSTIKEQVDVTLKVLRENRFPDAELVKMINAGLMDRRFTTWIWANKMESRLLKQWKSEHKTLRGLFLELKLNEAKTEMELYANPAFTKWMEFAFHLQRDESQGPNHELSDYGQQIACRSMLEVLEEEMENTTGFEDLVTLRVKTEQGSQNPEKLKELYQNWIYVYHRQWGWYWIVKE